MISKNKAQYMGVINLTPNSFSDGGKFNNSSSFIEHFISLSRWADIIDLGAESTAPFNQAIDTHTELQRFEEIFYPVLEAANDPAIQISIDTYKPEVFKEVALKVQKFWPNCSLIWNDVSGVVDDDLLELLHGPLKFNYVLSHNLCEQRSDTIKHMQFVENDLDIVSHLERFFEQALEKIQSKRSIWLDPCFGFSKSREQNHALLREFASLANKFSEHKWVYGISRKSFLRFPKELDSKSPHNQSQLDQVQSFFIADILQKVNAENMIFRIHDERTKNAVNSIMAILN